MKAKLWSFNKSMQNYWRKQKVTKTLFRLASCVSLPHPFHSGEKNNCDRKCKFNSLVEIENAQTSHFLQNPTEAAV